MKKTIAFAMTLILLFMLCIGELPTNAYADDTGYFGVGSYDDNQQGYRFTVYDYENKTVLSMLDVFYYQDGSKYNATVGHRELLKKRANGSTVRLGYGCKLQYLDIFNSVGKDVKQMRTRLITSKPANYSIWECKADYGTIFLPLTTDLDSAGTIKWTAKHLISTKLMTTDGTHSNVALVQLLEKLGYYLDVENADLLKSDKPLLPFEENYVLVAEPIYWFCNWFRVYSSGDFMQSEYFCGTTTEWAIYDQMVFNTYHKNVSGGVAGYGIHPVMGKLTYIASPLSCYQSERRVFGDYVIDKYTADDYKAESCYHPDSMNASEFAQIDKIIIEKMGVNVLTYNQMNEISLTVDISKTNTEFRPDTDAVISFRISQTDEEPIKYCPSYDDVGQSDAYGIKLTLTTQSFTDSKGRTISTPYELSKPIEITCDGLPAEASKTLAWTTLHMPDQTGTWRFKVQVDANIPSVVDDGAKEICFSKNVSYFTNTDVKGKKKVAKEFDYEITIVEPSEVYAIPPNTTADDESEGFVAPDPNSCTYISTPSVTELTWKYQKAVKNSKDSNNLFVEFKEETETARASLDKVYFPHLYDNIPSEYPSGIYADGLVHTRSGYGIGMSATMPVGKSYFQSGYVFYPEFSYVGYADKLELTRSGSYVTYNLPQNIYSLYYNTAKSDYSKVHFTPVWYPDGEYNAIVYMYDCWTPVGMMWDAAVYTIKLEGTVYDDWYITRH